MREQQRASKQVGVWWRERQRERECEDLKVTKNSDRRRSSTGGVVWEGGGGFGGLDNGDERGVGDGKVADETEDNVICIVR